LKQFAWQKLIIQIIENFLKEIINSIVQLRLGATVID